jgi:catechol 2,3-dioxygenase-like lactoylglutathione lyase family enzyme
LHRAKLDNAAAVFITPDVRRAAAYYVEVFGFTVVEHYDAPEPFAAIYRDSVEILLVQARTGASAKRSSAVPSTETRRIIQISPSVLSRGGVCRV